MHRSRTAFIVLAAAAAMAIAVVDRTVAVVDRVEIAWRVVSAWACDFGRWVIAKLPKARAPWLGAWRHSVAPDPRPHMTSTAYRRPLVSTRWRMCPST
jgi:hypothetical protein